MLALEYGIFLEEEIPAMSRRFEFSRSYFLEVLKILTNLEKVSQTEYVLELRSVLLDGFKKNILDYLSERKDFLQKRDLKTLAELISFLDLIREKESVYVFGFLMSMLSIYDVDFNFGKGVGVNALFLRVEKLYLNR